MIYSEEFSKAVIYKMLSAFSYHRIIVDENNCPIDYEYIDVNPAFETMTGLHKDDVIGKRILEIVPDIIRDHIDWIKIFGNVAITGESITFENKSEALHKWYSIHAYSPSPMHFIVLFHDITNLKDKELLLEEQKTHLIKAVNTLRTSEAELREKNEEIGALYEELTASEEELSSQVDTLLLKEEELRRLAFFDPLTGLENRNAFFQRIESFVSRCEITREKFAIIYLDMDDFKIVNDTMGHDYGDSVLKEVASRIGLHMNKRDVVARMAGDEFAIALYSIKDERTVMKCSQAIKTELEKPIVLNDLTFFITASMGVALYPKDGKSVKELMMNVDTAMYKGKENAKNDICFYVPAMKAEALRKTNLESMLRKAIENDHFKLYFQPQYDIRSKILRGFEALIRWENSELGMISPMYFIPLAEETGLINKIGDWVLEESCRLSQRWTTELGYQGIMSVNISPIQLRNPHFSDRVHEVVNAYNMTEKLELEITESVFIGQFQPVVDVLKDLKNKGLKISLDDFGTGYSSLNYLRTLPLNTLKIDRSFVANLGNDHIENHIAESIIRMVHKIGLEAVAEGVEKVEQLNFLQDMGCNIVQGFLTGKPLPQEDIPDIILRNLYDITG